MADAAAGAGAPAGSGAGEPHKMVNTAQLAACAGQTVRFTGRVAAAGGATVSLTGPDGGQASLAPTPAHSQGFFAQDGTYMVVAKVNADGSLVEESALQLATNFDMENLNKLLGVMSAAPDVF